MIYFTCQYLHIYFHRFELLRKTHCRCIKHHVLSHNITYLSETTHFFYHITLTYSHKLSYKFEKINSWKRDLPHTITILFYMPCDYPIMYINRYTLINQNSRQRELSLYYITMCSCQNNSFCSFVIYFSTCIILCSRQVCWSRRLKT